MRDVLVIDDEVHVLRAIKKLLGPELHVRTASTKYEGLRALRDRTRPPLSLILIDAKLGNERSAGLELLDVAAEEHKNVRRALITGSRDPTIRNGASARLAFVLSKPFGRLDLLPLLEAGRAPKANAMDSAIDRRAGDWNLTPRQRDIVRLALAGQTKEQIAGELGVSVNTCRSHVAEVLCRSNLAGLDHVVIALLRDVIADLDPASD